MKPAFVSSPAFSSLDGKAFAAFTAVQSAVGQATPPPRPFGDAHGVTAGNLIVVWVGCEARNQHVGQRRRRHACARSSR